MSVFRHQYKSRSGETKNLASWYVEFRDHTGRVRRMPGFRDKGCTLELERKLQTIVAVKVSGSTMPPDLIKWLASLPEAIAGRLARFGLVSSGQVSSRKSLSEHMDEWLDDLGKAGRPESHTTLLAYRVRALLMPSGAERLSDIDEITTRYRISDRQGDGLSQQTANHYVRAVKQFTRWLVSHGRLPADPLANLRGGNVASDRRIERRELTAAEIAWLLKCTRAGPFRSMLSGQQRALLYAVALSTGLRAVELASLRRRDFDLAAGTVTIKAQDEKAGRGATLPLPADAVALLREHLAGIGDGQLVWPGKWAAQKRAGKILKADAAAARAAGTDVQRATDFLLPEDQHGHKIDFHALRHTFLSRLSRSGAKAKVMQMLARHSTVELTMGRYTHANLADLTAAVASLPPIE